MVRYPVPAGVLTVLQTLRAAGHQAYVVGGAVRDSVLGLAPRDWDLATDALPDRILSLFPSAVPVGLEFGTVLIPIGGSDIQITTFRAASGFATSLEEDLAHRDFTVNAMAYNPFNLRLIDPADVAPYLRAGLLPIKAMGDPYDRFCEDPLRILRLFSLVGLAGRASCTWSLDPSTWTIAGRLAYILRSVAIERIREELNKILLSPNADTCLRLMCEAGVMQHALPFLVPCRGVYQGKYHCFDLFEHTLHAVKHVPPELHLRWAALLHDLGKLYTRTEDETGIHFYGHAERSAELARDLLTQYRFSSRFIDRVTHLIAHHMFDLPSTKRAIRRLVSRVGREYILDLIALRTADHAARGRDLNQDPVFVAFVEQLEETFDEVMPLSVRDLAVNGHDVMRVLAIPPGPQVGAVLNNLLMLVLDDPSLNERERLLVALNDLKQKG